jgi:hypothetical protein
LRRTPACGSAATPPIARSSRVRAARSPYWPAPPPSSCTWRSARRTTATSTPSTEPPSVRVTTTTALPANGRLPRGLLLGIRARSRRKQHRAREPQPLTSRTTAQPDGSHSDRSVLA